MSLTATIILLIGGWLAVAAAMLWGILRIARRHHHPQVKAVAGKPRQPAAHHA